MFSTLKELIIKGRNVVPLEKRNKTLVYLFIIIATSLDNVNVAGTLTSIFSITESFDSPTTTISWVLSSYALTLGAFIIIAGKLADVLGPHNVFLVGLFFQSLFALIAAVIVKEVIALIVFRALQGMFAASLIPSAFALTGNYFQGKALNMAVTGFLLSLTAVFGIGTILGGAFSESAIGYKGLYYFTFAIGMFFFICLYFLIIPIKQTEGHKTLKVKNLDFGGSIALVAGLLLVTLGLTEGGESWRRPVAYVPLIIGVLVVILVVLFEMVYIQRFKDRIDTQDNPDESTEFNDWRYKLQLLFPREVVSLRNFNQYLISTFLYFMIYIAILSTMVQYYQYITLDTPIMAALKSSPVSIGLAFGSVVYRAKVAEKVGTKIIVCSSPIVVLTMGVWLSRLDFRMENSFWKYECFSQFLLGWATNNYFQVYWNDVIVTTPLHLQGVVSGILQTAGQVGICFGNAIIASLVGNLAYDTSFEVREKLHYKFRKNFYLVFAASAVLFLVLLTLREKPSEKVVDEEESGSVKG